MVSTAVTEGAERPASRLEDLYERHAPAAVRLAFLITSDRELSRDVVQDAFVRVAGRFGHLRFPDTFDLYLRRTVVNLCMSHFRHQRVEREDCVPAELPARFCLSFWTGWGTWARSKVRHAQVHDG